MLKPPTLMVPPVLKVSSKAMASSKAPWINKGASWPYDLENRLMSCSPTARTEVNERRGMISEFAEGLGYIY